MSYANNTNVGTAYRNAITVIGPNPTFTGVLQGGDVSAGAASYIGWLGRSRMRSSVDGVVNITNNAETGVTRVNIGPASASFAGFSYFSGVLAVKKGDDSAFASLYAQTFVVVSGTVTGFNTTRLDLSVDGNLLLVNNATTDFGLLKFGGATSAFGAIKRSGAGLRFRLADDSGDCAISSGLFTTSSVVLMASSAALTDATGAGLGTLTNAPTAGNPTKWITINDNGTVRKIPTWT